LVTRVRNIMKIRQCFLELQLKIPGMFLRHSVDCEIHRTVQQGQQLTNDKYNEKDRIQNTQRAVQTRFNSATYNQQQRTSKGRKRRLLKLVIVLLCPDSG